MSDSTLFASTAAARRQATGLLVGAAAAVAVPVVAVAVIVGLLSGLAVVIVPLGVLFGLIAAAAVVLPARRQAEARAVELLDPRRADPLGDARLFNLVDGLCAAAGVVRPQLYVLDRPAPNAITFGRDARHGCLIVTEGLLRSLSRIELEGVIAHELAHLLAGDTVGPTMALALCGSRTTGAMEGVATRLVTRAAPARREAAADIAGVSLTRYPPGLLTALEGIRAGGVSLRGVPRPTAPLWLAPIDGSPGEQGLGERIEALREL